MDRGARRRVRIGGDEGRLGRPFGRPSCPALRASGRPDDSGFDREVRAYTPFLSTVVHLVSAQVTLPIIGERYAVD